MQIDPTRAPASRRAFDRKQSARTVPVKNEA
jgi:hypothetical protein